MPRKNFVKRTEDFRCEVCGAEVKGTGYTDHCPHCLWGKHVDEEVPGDRQSGCGGLMESTGLRYKSGKQQIKYRCDKCGKIYYCKVAEADNPDELTKLQ